MGSRGSFVDVSSGNYSFTDNGQNYYSLGTLSSDSNVKVLVQNSGSVKAPEFSHTAERIYATTQDGVLKHLTYYDANHKQAISIDLTIPHNGMLPHKHLYLDHTTAYPLTDSEIALIKKIRKEFHLK